MLILKIKLIFFYLVFTLDISLLLKHQNCYISVGVARIAEFDMLSRCQTKRKTEQQPEWLRMIHNRIAVNINNYKSMMGQFVYNIMKQEQIDIAVDQQFLLKCSVSMMEQF